MINTSFNHNDDIQPTRAELKRRMDRLQDLGKRLTELTPGKLHRIDLPEKLRSAVNEAQRLTAMGAKRRQLQYIGRIMEEFDAAAIARGLRDIDLPARSTATASTDSEAVMMAQGIINGDDDALYAAYGSQLSPQDLQRLRQAVRLAKKAIASGAEAATEIAKLAKMCSNFTGV